MWRSISRATVVAVIMAVLVVSASPVSAASTNLALGGAHDTYTELSNGTLTDTVVSGSGASAVVELATNVIADDFEDGTLDGWTDAGINWDVTSGNAASGSYKLEYTVSGTEDIIYYGSQAGSHTVGGYIQFASSSDQYSGLAFGTTNSNAAKFVVDPSSDTVKIEGNVDATASGTASLGTSTWYWYEFEKSGSTLTGRVYSDKPSLGGSLLGEISTTTTLGSVYGGLRGWEAARFDSITVGNKTVDAGSYVSAPHDVTNPTEGRVSLALANASADVTWQVDPDADGTWTNVTTATHTTGGLKTADVSSTSADRWRVHVEFRKTGSNPTAELDSDSVYFVNDAPTVDAGSASPTGGELSRYQNVTLSAGISDAEFGSAQGESVTVEWYVDGVRVGESTASSAGTVSYEATELADGSHAWHVVATDSHGGTTTSATWSFEVNHYAPTVDASSAAPTGGEVISDPTLSVDVSDRDFGIDGDSLTVEFVVDGASIGTDTLTANGTASIDWSGATGGSHTWSATVTDAYGQTATSTTWSFAVPSELHIRNETNYDELISGSQATVTLRFFGEDTVVEKTTTDGTISLDGLPVNQELIVVARADGFYDRRIVLTSLIEQQSIYLLNESETAVFNRFSTDDQSGQFSDGSTKLYIEKPINTSGTVEWVVIAGDYVGAADSFPVELAKDARYRIKAENSQGDVRALGSYIAATEGNVPLTIGRINWQAPDEDTLRWEVFTSKSGNVTVLNLHFEDPNTETPATDFDVRIYERGNESNVLYQDSLTNVTAYDAAQPLSTAQESTTWIVEWSVEHQDVTAGDSRPVGAVAELPIPIDAKWATPLMFVFLVAVAAAFPSSMSRVGAMVLVAMATGAAWLGWAEIPLVAIGVAGAIALLGATSQVRSY